jgi:nucleotide-binding universal stress UspA family protein
MFRKILLAHDGSDGSQKAFDKAVELATKLRAELHMISVEEDLPRHAQTMDEVREEKGVEDTYFGELTALSRRRAAIRGINLKCSIVQGHEVKAIVDFVRQGGFDLLVVGFTGHSKIYDHLWGGTSQNLTRLASCSVLVIK